MGRALRTAWLAGSNFTDVPSLARKLSDKAESRLRVSRVELLSDGTLRTLARFGEGTASRFR